MEGSEVNKIVVDAYSSASKALKTIRIESNVTAEPVETAMEMFEDEVRFNRLYSSSPAIVVTNVVILCLDGSNARD